MNYKTIVLELLLQRPHVCRRLKRDRKMLEAVNAYASILKANHEAIQQTLLQGRPQGGPTQLASEAMEIAVKDLEQALPSESGQLDESHHLSLDRAMAYLLKHSPLA